MTADLAAFEQFARDAAALLAAKQAAPPVPSLDVLAANLSAFRNAALPVIVRDAERYVRWVAPRCACLFGVRQKKPVDLLEVAGLAFDENAYTELIAWALDPGTHAGAAERLQRAWLRAVLGEESGVARATEPMTQVHVPCGGIVDLVLAYPELVVVVEVKTGSAEHDVAQSQTPQTIQYAREIHEALGIAATVPVRVVLLAPELRGAANSEAVAATSAEFALLLGEQLAGPDYLTTCGRRLRSSPTTSSRTPCLVGRSSLTCCRMRANGSTTQSMIVPRCWSTSMLSRAQRPPCR